MKAHSDLCVCLGFFCVGLPFGACFVPLPLLSFRGVQGHSTAVGAAMASDMDTTQQKVLVRRLDLQGCFFQTSWLNKVHGIYLCTRAGWYVRVAAVVCFVTCWLAF